MSETNNPELTREDLLAIVNETVSKIKTIQNQIDKIEEFFKINLVDEGENKSNQKKLKELIDSVKTDAKEIGAIREAAEQFKTETFLGTEERPSTKKEIANALNEVKVKQQEIISAHKLLLENEEGRNSIKTQTLNLKNEIEQFKTETLHDIDDKKSTKTILNNLITEANNLIANSQKLNTAIEDKHIEICAAQKLLLDDEDGRDSVKTQIIKIKEVFNNNLAENEKYLKKLKIFYKNVFEIIIDDETGTERPGLKVTVESLASRLEKLTSQAEKKLFGLTDSSLQHAFTSRARKYSLEFTKLQKITFWLTLALVGDIAIFGIIQLCISEFDWHLLIYQFSIAGALVFAIFMYNRNQKIAKKLAEEYQHKASLTEAMTGYRELYSLEHKDSEYMELFNSLKEQLNTNPSKQIDTFLRLKSPHEELSSSINGLLDSENLKAIAEQVKALIKQNPTGGA